MKNAKDLSLEAPRSPRIRLGGYVLMARMIDKGVAVLENKAGEYHFACPLDQMLFDFKAVEAQQVKELLGTAGGDGEVVEWFNSHGASKTAEEITAWSNAIEAALPYNNPEKKEWFAGECAGLGLDPAVTTLFEYLEADDLASFKN